jgi:hypothetical protein
MILINKVNGNFLKNREREGKLNESAMYVRVGIPVSLGAKTGYQSMTRNGDADLGLAADCLSSTSKNKEQYLCAALDKSMEGAIQLIHPMAAG